MWTGEGDLSRDVSGGAGLFQQRFKILAEMSSDGVCVHRDGRIIYANSAAVRWMGVDPAVGLIGRRVAEFVHADSYPDVKRRLQGLHREGDFAPPKEVLMGRPKKSARDVQATSTQIEWDGGPAVVSTFKDLTAVKASAVLKVQAALLNHVSDAVIAVSPTGTVTAWNAAAEAIYRLEAEQARNLPVSEAVGAPLDAKRVAQSGGMVHTTHFATDGTPLSVRVSSAETENGHVVICADLTALRRAERHFEAVVTAIDAGVVVFGPDGSVESVNPTARRIFAGVASGKAPFALDVPLVDVDGRPIAADSSPLGRAVGSGAPQVGHVVGVRRVDGHVVWLSVSVRFLGPDYPGHSPVLCSFVDVTAQKLASEQLVHAAGHDALTGLPNRSTALSLLNSSLAPEAERTLRAVLFIDVDGLKSINDSYGHSAGDIVLIAFATRVREALHDGDIVARLAGDEFVVLLFDGVAPPNVDRIADTIHGVLSDPVYYRDAALTATSSIGIARIESDEVWDALEVLRAADDAMYAAKASGPGRTRYAT